MSYRIGAYLIDPAAHEIRREDAVVPVEPQVFDLLIFLIENRQRTVSKDEIIESIWKGRIVSDANLSSRISPAGLAVAKRTITNFIEKASRLYEQERRAVSAASPLEKYVRRWFRWAMSCGIRVAIVTRSTLPTAFPRT